MPFELVRDDEDQTATSHRPPPPKDNAAATAALMLALRALSQRAIAAIADLFTLFTVASAFWLWYSTPDPNVFQIVSLSIYALFVLAANWIVRSRR